MKIAAAIAAIALIAILIGQCISSIDSEGIPRERECPTCNIDNVNIALIEESPRNDQSIQLIDENLMTFAYKTNNSISLQIVFKN